MRQFENATDDKIKYMHLACELPIFNENMFDEFTITNCDACDYIILRYGSEPRYKLTEWGQKNPNNLSLVRHLYNKLGKKSIYDESLTDITKRSTVRIYLY